MKNSGIEWIGEIPEDWDVRRVKNCFYLSKYKANQKNPTILRLSRDGIQVRDISNNEGQLAANYEDYNPVLPGDLLLNPMDLYSGANCNVSEISGVISPAYANLRANVKLNAKYFDYYFKIQYWTMAMFAHGKGVSYDNRWTINTDTLLAYEMPFPPYKLQTEIVKFLNQKLEGINKIINNQNAQIEKLKEYKQSIITEAVTKNLHPIVNTTNISEDWIENIPNNWELIPLKVLFSFDKGLPITKADLTPSGIKVISYGQIHAKFNKKASIDERLYRFVDKKYLDSNKNSIVKLGDFIFADTSEDVEGTGDFVYIDNNDLIFAGYHCIILKAKNNYKNKFLAYLFMSLKWQQQIHCRVCGVKLFSLSRSILNKLTVLLPPFNEQEQIAEYLDKKCTEIDELISIKQQKIEKLNEYKKSLIYEYVTGKKDVCSW